MSTPAPPMPAEPEARTHEVIVVGGGPAGAAAAWALRRSDVDCLVIDRARFPREKLCAGWITPEVLSDLELTPADYPHGLVTFGALRVAVRGLRRELASTQHSIRRLEFDAWLLERAGVPVVEHTVRRVARDGEDFVIDGRFRARFLIGAGGTRCPVFRDLFRERYPRSRALQVVTQELEYACNDADRDCRLWFFDEGLPGYGWCVPKADGYVNVGVGGIAQTLKSRGDDIRRHWRALLRRVEDECGIAAPAAAPGGYSYYLRAHRGVCRAGNAFVVGDAAGLATRDMCEGIGPAVRSGINAARAISTGARDVLQGVAPHTLGNPVLHHALDFALTRRH